MHGNSKDLKGNRYGNLVVLELTDKRLQGKRGNVWKCRCDCGNICYKTADTLNDKRRKTWSCGCMSKKKKFPDKFITKEIATRADKAREEFANLLMERFKGKPYEEELKEGIEDALRTYQKNKEKNK